MRAILHGSLFLAAAVLLSGPVRGQDTLDDVKRRLKIESDRIEADVRDSIATADKLAKKTPKEAIAELRFTSTKLGLDRALTPERRQDLQSQLDARIRSYQQAVSRGGVVDWDERIRANQERQRGSDQRQAEQRQMSGQISELYKQGKFAEAAEVNKRWAEKYGKSPTGTAVGRAVDLRSALTDIRGIKDERDRRYRTAMAQVIKSSMPIVNESGIEFPANWRELTKRRQPYKLSPEEEKLLKAMQTPITTELKAQPIQGVLDEFEKRYGVHFNLDKAAMDQLMVTADTPVNIKARSTSLRTVLKQMFADVGLTYIIRNGEAYVTSPERATQFMTIRTYYVGDLITSFGQTNDPFGQNQLAAVQSIASLIQMVQGIEPGTWQAGGGGGTIAFDPLRMAIIVKQSAEMHFMLQGSFR